MNSNRLPNRHLPALCGELHPDDGVDPAEFFRPSRKKHRDHRKAQQLCHQVADTLNLVLSSEANDELRDLRVVAVRPAPDASQLLVVVAAAVDGQQIDVDRVLARLAAASGRLRSEVAGAITRRRAPKLLFQFAAEPTMEERT